MITDVFLTKTSLQYDAYPFDNPDGDIVKALKRLWTAWGLEPENPFQNWVKPGGCIVIKPNWVTDINPLGFPIDSLVTHASIIKYLLDWSGKALNGKGMVIIGDSPVQGCDFNNLLIQTNMTLICQAVNKIYPALEITVEDWRLTTLTKDYHLMFPACPQNEADFKTGQSNSLHTLIDAGSESFLEEIAEYSDKFRVTMYQPSLMGQHHKRGKHEYLVTNRAFEADLFINVPKMKTHKKTGMTGALKNIVGINGHKEFLPHHITGSSRSGGDSYCKGNALSTLADKIYDNWWENIRSSSKVNNKAHQLAYGFFRKLSTLTGADDTDPGSWPGNNTLWRTILDLNHILYFSGKKSRKIINVVDGITAGQGEGPLSPEPKEMGVLVAGENPALIDAVLARLMGYDISRIPIIHQALTHKRSRFAFNDLTKLEVSIIEEDKSIIPRRLSDLPTTRFKKPKHWESAEIN